MSEMNPITEGKTRSNVKNPPKASRPTAPPPSRNSRKVTEQMVKAGEDMAAWLIDVSVSEMHNANIGGCSPFNIDDYPKEFHEIILKYKDDEITSVEAIYRAMEMAK